jgi:8-oxo-dGTP pyrophosphatase MutT (NUDIX family)
MVKLIFKIAHTLRKIYWKTFKVKTRGVRVILIKNNKVLLVQHRYNNLWVFPGGGVDRDEDLYSGGKREVLEETGYKIKDFELILGSYLNTKEGKDDNVTVLVSRDFILKDNANLFSKILRLVEIKQMEWFDIGYLPKSISRATEERLWEYFSGKSNIEGMW